MKHYSNENITPEAFYRDVYATKARWVSYYHQIRLVKGSAGGGTVLVIGVGDGVVANYLKALYQIKTVDIIRELNPDYVASVENLSGLPNDGFDAVLCAEVLEHLPFEKFGVCLEGLKRISRGRVIISLPYWGYTFGLCLRLPLFGSRVLKFKFSGIKKQQSTRQHFWEIGKRGFPIRKIKRVMNSAGFDIQNSFWDIDDPYHYYFVLKKR